MTATAIKTTDDKRVAVLIDPLPMSYFRITVNRLSSTGNGSQRSVIRSEANLRSFLNEANKQRNTMPEVLLNINSLYFTVGFIPEDFGNVNDRPFPPVPQLNSPGLTSPSLSQQYPHRVFHSSTHIKRTHLLHILPYFPLSNSLIQATYLRMLSNDTMIINPMTPLLPEA
jgi:hypothetical protein